MGSEALGLGFTKVVAFMVTQGFLSIISPCKLCWFSCRKVLLVLYELKHEGILLKDFVT
jgi:hypothetical protein